MKKRKSIKKIDSVLIGPVAKFSRAKITTKEPVDSTLESGTLAIQARAFHKLLEEWTQMTNCGNLIGLAAEEAGMKMDVKEHIIMVH